jgi:hypothetical protein
VNRQQRRRQAALERRKNVTPIPAATRAAIAEAVHQEVMAWTVGDPAMDCRLYTGIGWVLLQALFPERGYLPNTGGFRIRVNDEWCFGFKGNSRLEKHCWIATPQEEFVDFAARHYRTWIAKGQFDDAHDDVPFRFLDTEAVMTQQVPEWIAKLDYVWGPRPREIMLFAKKDLTEEFRNDIHENIEAYIKMAKSARQRMKAIQDEMTGH